MAAYFLVFLAFTGCMAVAVDVAAGEKERGTLEAMLVTPASFWEITFGKLLFVVTMGLLSVASTAIGIVSMVVAVGSAIEGMSLGGVGWVSILGILFLILVMVFFFAVLLFALSILARSSKEAHMRGSLLMLFIAMALVYCTLPWSFIYREYSLYPSAQCSSRSPRSLGRFYDSIGLRYRSEFPSAALRSDSLVYQSQSEQ